ncbi:MAG: AAA family ATPase [Bacilli bacterium]|nr:AAA family ATPase [Bacilli bacterium]
MYLKNIKAHGFKSFAEHIDMELNNGITGVVGPNGSGKSNIVDAIRWVLGEQSVKSLRGDGNMADVIFSGSKSRTGMNVASVTLIFDNKDHYLPVRYDEVAIKRRVYKDGSNEYSLNGEKCRLKDITEILMDSGVAKESFNIISQGKIEEIISSKPTDRRIIFEEAAGVLKYKRRKEEALRKLERTHDNMNRVNDIVKELEVQVTPLKMQKEQAEKYLSTKNELEQIEIALIASDIEKVNAEYQTKKNRIEILNGELLNANFESNKGEAKIEEYKVKQSKLEVEMNELQASLLEYTKLVEQLNSKKMVLLEQKKYQVDDNKLHHEMVTLKEEELNLRNQIELLEQEISSLDKAMTKEKAKVETYQKELEYQKKSKRNLEEMLTKQIRLERNLEIAIENLQESIENNGTLPHAVKAVLDHPKLRGIHNVIGNVIEVEEKYTKAIMTSLGYGASYLIVDDEQSAKEAITYLKQNKLGRATFFPMSVIKPKYVDYDTIKQISDEKVYIDIASNLIKYDKKYDGILKNQLGNVLVVDTLESANKIAKKIAYRYRIVTLDGELLHVGGSLTGGEASKNRNILIEKQELETKLKDYDTIVKAIQELENKMNEIDASIKEVEDNEYLANKSLIEVEEIAKNKRVLIADRKEYLNQLEEEMNRTSHLMNHTLDEEETKILNEFYQKEQEKKSIELKLSNKVKEKQELVEELQEFEFELRRENSALNSKNKELKELEIEVNRMDVKLDHYLTTLSESYNMTFEKARADYALGMEEELARTKVMNLKREMKELGMVNLGAIDEYARVSERYEFLIHQSEDLVGAENTLLEIISEMDTVMEKEFIDTFKTIGAHFEETFKELFHGGMASLKLTDPNNVLETGIEIVASPPGKKLTSISLLSGGEKTFTAISLLFAILKSRPVPFCVLDEVEAALDEVNVDSFGKYLLKLKEKTQFILITHKKKTMEYADVLYGITMQESGVSKLVSVKLEEL